jgi:SAM-dependent methyltransferase
MPPGPCRIDNHRSAIDNRTVPDPYAVDADFYDAIHSSFAEDIGLWLSFAGRTDRPVLEIGCGTGRIALELALNGHTVTGIDPSPAMLQLARARAEEEAIDVTLIEGEFAEMAIEQDHYGFVLLPLDVFLYCKDAEAQLATLRAIAGALTFNGLLAIDVPGPALWLDPSANGQPMLTFTGETASGVRFDCWHMHEDDLAAQTRDLRVTYETLSEDGAVRRRVSQHRLRYVYRFELEYLLGMAGLALAGMYGDYDLGPLTNDSERMIAIARRDNG